MESFSDGGRGGPGEAARHRGRRSAAEEIESGFNGRWREKEKAVERERVRERLRFEELAVVTETRPIWRHCISSLIRMNE